MENVQTWENQGNVNALSFSRTPRIQMSNNK